MTKVLISSQGADLDSQVDPRFGRASFFVVVDTETFGFEAIDNSAGKTAAQGAGIQAAETAAKSGAQAVLSGFVGPKAFAALNAAGIKIGQGVDGMTVKEAAEKFIAGEVEMASAPSKPGHWG